MAKNIEKGSKEWTEEWHKIGNMLCNYFQICQCQRKLKSIIDNLVSIYNKIDEHYEKGTELNFTGVEWLIIAQLDAHSACIQHGINCEYPILIKDDPFWLWIMEVKDSPYLEDN